MAALVTNVQEGVSDIVVIVLAHISDTHMTRFKMIVSTNAAYFLFESSQTVAKVYYGAVVLIVLGEAGRSATLKEFLENQYFSEDKERPSTDKNYLKRLETRKEALWHHPWFLGALLAVFLSTPTWTITRVTSSSSSSCPPEEAQRKKFWPLIELKAEKGFFIEVIAMWSAFFAYSLVEATGSTFFFEQMSSLDTKSGIGSVMDVAVFFTLVSRFSSFLVSFIYDLLIPKQWRKATLVRIGCGLACSMLCCVAAWLVEGKRLKSPVTVTNQRIEGDTRTTFAMSTWWLIPQFVQLGLMEGLALNGLTEFLADRIANNDRLRARYYYASHISDLILGVGKLVTASSILVFRRSWFHPNINGSHLDRFFELLTYLSLANLIYYMCISVYFYHNEKSRKSANKGNKQSSLLEQVEQGIHAAEKEADVEEAPVPVGGADLENKQTAEEQVEQEIDDDDEEVWTSETTKEIKNLGKIEVFFEPLSNRTIELQDEDEDVAIAPHYVKRGRMIIFNRSLQKKIKRASSVRLQSFKCKALGESSQPQTSLAKTVYPGIYGPWIVDSTDVREASQLHAKYVHKLQKPPYDLVIA
ncbi:hypothetical protein ACE6H2_001265 [Prunus campanulata]